MINPNRSGIGMTSARTRERLIQRLRDQGIVNPRVLDQIRNVPRHLFVDEALGTRVPTRTPRCPSATGRPSRSRSSWRR